MRVDRDTPYFWRYEAWLDGVEVSEIGGCFEADDEAGYIKIHPKVPGTGRYIETEPGSDELIEETRYGTVVIQAPTPEVIAEEEARAIRLAKRKGVPDA